MKRLLWLLALILVFAIGCRDDDDDDEVEILSAEHDGWENPVCDDCHEDHHKSDLDYHQCVECHGRNGAPFQPVAAYHPVTCGDAAAGETGCHGGAHGGPEAGFPTGDCIACHPQQSAP